MSDLHQDQAVLSKPLVLLGVNAAIYNGIASVGAFYDAPNYAPIRLGFQNCIGRYKTKNPSFLRQITGFIECCRTSWDVFLGGERGIRTLDRLFEPILP